MIAMLDPKMFTTFVTGARRPAPAAVIGEHEATAGVGDTPWRSAAASNDVAKSVLSDVAIAVVKVPWLAPLGDDPCSDLDHDAGKPSRDARRWWWWQSAANASPGQIPC